MSVRTLMRVSMVFVVKVLVVKVLVVTLCSVTNIRAGSRKLKISHLTYISEGGSLCPPINNIPKGSLKLLKRFLRWTNCSFFPLLHQNLQDPEKVSHFTVSWLSRL